MIFCDDIWKIIKSYLLNKNDINRRLFIKQMDKNSQERDRIYKNNHFKTKISNVLYEMYLKDLSEKKLNFRLASY
jgi:hypothetical protein